MWQFDQFKVIGSPSVDLRETARKALQSFQLYAYDTVVVLDGFDRSDYPFFQGKLGLCCHIGSACLRHPSKAPSAILELIPRNRATHLIWISERICSGPSDRLLWTLAHEGQHLAQVKHSIQLLNAGALLGRTRDQIFGVGSSWINIPTEIDCELAAWRVMRETHSHDFALTYLRSTDMDDGLSGVREALVRHDPDASYPVVDETLALLNKHRSMLEEETHPRDLQAMIDDLSKLRRVRGAGNI